MSSRSNSFFNLFANQLRLSNPWNYKVPLLLAIPYLVLLGGEAQASSGYMFIGLSYATIIGIACFGYLTNDLADREVDKKAGKPNGTAGLSMVQTLGITVLSLVFAIAPWLIFPTITESWFMLGIELLLFLIYAFPPFRLKEKPILGAVTDALYAHALPALLAAWTFILIINELVEAWEPFLTALILWQFVVGVRGILFHQVKDFENDSVTSQRTMATAFGKARIEFVVKWTILPIELLTFLWFVFQLNRPEIIGITVVSVFFIRSIYWQLKLGKSLDYRAMTHAHLDDFYIRWLPIIVLAIMVFLQPLMVGLAILHVLVFPSPLNDAIKMVWSRAFPPKEEYKRPETDALPHPKTEGVLRIGIATNNRHQYSETFIHAHINKLVGEVVVMYNGYLPLEYEGREEGDHGMLCKEEWQELSDPEKRPFRQKCVADFLVERQIDVVLAEFGPGGAEMLRPCHMANVPMVVHYHGFGASREDVLSHYGLSYPRMFNEAFAVIAVSDPMLTKLLALGCPEPKLKLIPYGIDTDLFKPDDAKSAPTILSCGRFVSKKAPHLTIKVFHQVLQKLPELKLIMIGDGPLMKDCKSLIQQLGIGESIELKGVLPPEEVVNHLQQATVFIQHSVTANDGDSEGLPLSILEALACGLPVVATRHAGIPSVVIDGETGHLVDEGDVDTMANHIYGLMKNNRMRAEMSRRGRKLIESNYSVDRYISELQVILKEAADQ